MGLTGACHDHVPGTSISLEYELSEHQTTSLQLVTNILNHDQVI